MQKIIGYISKEVIDTLQLHDIEENTPIYIGDTNIRHIKNRHPFEYEVYFPDIQNIISNPDYVGYNNLNPSILFVKLYKFSNDYIRVAIRISVSGKFFVKSLHHLSTCNAERYIEKCTLKKLDKSSS